MTTDKALPVITRNTAVLEEWFRAADAHHNTQKRAIEDAKALGAEGLAQWTSFFGDTHTTGLIPPYGAEPPAGWFLRKKDGVWRPIRKTKNSPQEVLDAHAWMEDHRVSPRPAYALRKYGMNAVTQGPADRDGTRMWGAAKVVLLTDAIVVDPRLGAWFEGEPDPAYWTPIKRSEFEALLEESE